jgi:transposase-like protein
VSYVQASQQLNVHPSQLRDWVKKLSEDPQHAFPGHSQMKPEQLKIARLRRELAKLKGSGIYCKKLRLTSQRNRREVLLQCETPGIGWAVDWMCDKSRWVACMVG